MDVGLKSTPEARPAGWRGFFKLPQVIGRLVGTAPGRSRDAAKPGVPHSNAQPGPQGTALADSKGGPARTSSAQSVARTQTRRTGGPPPLLQSEGPPHKPQLSPPRLSIASSGGGVLSPLSPQHPVDTKVGPLSREHIESLYKAANLKLSKETTVSSQCIAQNQKESARRMGSVYLVAYDVGETLLNRAFAPVRTQGSGAAFASGISPGNLQMVLRNLAAKELNDALGFDVIPPMHMGTALIPVSGDLKGGTARSVETAGLVMPSPPGTRGGLCAEDYEKPEVARVLTRLQLVDLLGAVVARGWSDYELSFSPDDKPTVHAFDSGDSFGKRITDPDDIRPDQKRPHDAGTRMPPMIDEDMARAIERLTPGKLEDLLGENRTKRDGQPLLDSDEISATQSRLAAMKRHVQSLRDRGCVVAVHEWGRKETVKRFWDLATIANSYVARDWAATLEGDMEKRIGSFRSQYSRLRLKPSAETVPNPLYSAQSQVGDARAVPPGFHIVTYRVAGKDVQKPFLLFPDSVSPAAIKHGVPLGNPQLVLRNLAVKELNDALGFDAVPDMQVGTALLPIDGASTSGERPVLETAGLVLGSPEGKVSNYSSADYDNPEVVRALTKLQLLDHLAGVVDRGQYGYVLRLLPHGGAKMYAYYNSQSFCKDITNPNDIRREAGHDRRKFNDGTRMPPMIDEDMARAIERLTADRLDDLLGANRVKRKCQPLLTPDELIATKDRLAAMKWHVQALRRKQCVVPADQWSQKKTMARFRSVATSGNSYAERDRMSGLKRRTGAVTEKDTKAHDKSVKSLKEQYLAVNLRETKETEVGRYASQRQKGDAVELGHGFFNKVYRVNYDFGETGETVVFKPLPDTAGPAAYESGISEEDPRIVQRNLATHTLACMLWSKVIPLTTMGTAMIPRDLRHEPPGPAVEKVGLVMERARGKDGNHLDPEVFDHPEVVRQLTELQLLDHLAGQVDRHAGNYIVSVRGSEATVKGVDNDQSFCEGITDPEGHRNVGRHKTRYHKGTHMPPMIDEVMAQAIERLTPQDIQTYLGKDREKTGGQALLTPEEVAATQQRLAGLKRHVAKLRDDGCVIARDGWRDQAVMVRFRQLASKDNSYVARDRLRAGK